MPGSHLALDVLALIAVANEVQDGYDRERFGYPGDLDGDGCDTRAEVLIRDSLTPAQVDPAGCHVVAGDWRSPYDGVTWTDPAELEIDHVVALKEAHDSGAWAWQPNRLVAFGNDLDDPRTLRAVTAAVNRDKGDADPSNWLPPDETYLCTYLGDWVAIKARWGLSMDQSEHGRIRNLLTDRCPGHVIAPWPDAPPDAPPPTVPPTARPRCSRRSRPAGRELPPLVPDDLHPAGPARPRLQRRFGPPLRRRCRPIPTASTATATASAAKADQGATVRLSVGRGPLCAIQSSGWKAPCDDCTARGVPRTDTRHHQPA